ncbi:203_t:CDS:2, partial [Cetraspora pellucida]
DEHESVVSQEHISKKKRHRGMNLKTTLEKNKGFQDLRKFFADSNSQDEPSHKRYPCSGLCKEKHLKYIERVGGFAVSGGAPLVKIVAQELFPDKFTENTKFSYSKLSSNQSKRLNDELSARLLRQKSGECMSDTSICLENMARFKRLADSLNYKGPVIAMTDNTKVYPRLGYSANLGCIIGSVFSLDQTMVNDYNEAESVIQNIISNNAIAKQVRLYLLQAYMNGTLNEVIKDKTSGVETINILRQWPSDEDLLCAVHEGYQQACDLAKVLSMVNQNEEVYGFLNISNGRSNQSDDENDDFFDYFNDSIQSNEILDSHAIAMAANTVADSNTIEIRDDDIENDLRDARSELTFLLSDANFSNIHDLETCENFYTGITEAGTLDISYLVNLQKNHKCYSNQDMERKTICRIQNFNHINSVSPNMISSLIANRISNIEISQTEKLRGIRWKNRCRLSVLSSTNKKVDLNGITVANIGEHNPLHKHGYGFSYINHEICLVQILALYQKNSNYHSYVRDDVFNIDSLSYLSVKVFFPLRNNIFSPLANSGHMVFSHINAKFFIYFLGFGDFIHVDEQHNLITLIGKALELYRFFNECSTKNLLRIIVHSEVKKD